MAIGHKLNFQTELVLSNCIIADFNLPPIESAKPTTLPENLTVILILRQLAFYKNYTRMLSSLIGAFMNESTNFEAMHIPLLVSFKPLYSFTLFGGSGMVKCEGP